MIRLFCLLFGIVIFLNACTGPYIIKDERRGPDTDGKMYPFNALRIPKGHLPPPGECKIWIPGRPPGQQGPPQDCLSAFRNVPLGAWVITHAGNRYKVNIFSNARRGQVEEVRFYGLQ